MDFVQHLLLLIGFILSILYLYFSGHLQNLLQLRVPSQAKTQKRQPKLPKPKSEQDCPYCQAEKQRTPAGSARSVVPWSQIKSRCGCKKVFNSAGFACPNPTCDYFKITDAAIHAIVSAGWHGKRRDIRWLKCQACGQCFTQYRNTPLFRLKTHASIVSMALKALAMGINRSVVGTIFGVTDQTLLRWLVRSGQHAERLHNHFFQHLVYHHLQLDELYLRVRGCAEGQWLWVALDGVNKLILGFATGSRKAEMAYRIVHQIKPLLRLDTLPVFTTDGLKHYFYALTAHFGTWYQVGRQRVWQVSPDLLYGQLKKIQRRGRLLNVEHHMLLGSLADLRSRLKAVGLSGRIQTSFVERLNLTLRHSISFLARRTWSLPCSTRSLDASLAWFRVYYHFARPHSSLRVLLQMAERSPCGRLRKRRPRTPAMAAGLTDHPWSVLEILRCPLIR